MIPEKTSPADNETIKRLTALTPLEYDRVRNAEAKTLNIRPATLDNLVKAAKLISQKEIKTPFTEIEPWHEPINPVELLTDISNTIKRFIICPPETIHAATLWIAMTWFIDVIQVAPLAVITAPEKKVWQKPITISFRAPSQSTIICIQYITLCIISFN